MRGRAAEVGQEEWTSAGLRMIVVFRRVCRAGGGLTDGGERMGSSLKVRS